MKKSNLKNRWTAQNEADEAARRKQKAEMLRRSEERYGAPKKKQGHLHPVGYRPDEAKKNGLQQAVSKRRKKGAAASAEPTITPPSARKGRVKSERKPLNRQVIRSQWAQIRNLSSKPDMMFLQISMILLAVGLVMVLSSSSYNALIEYGDGLKFFKRQLLFAFFGLVAMVLMMLANIEVVRRLSFPALVVVAAMVLFVSFYSTPINGAQRWLQIGAFSFMPADFAKPLMAISFASWLINVKENLNNIQIYLMTLALMAVVPGIIVIEDLGTAIAFFGALFAMIVVAGAPYHYVGGTLLAGVVAIVGAILVKPYRMMRIISFLDPFNPEMMKSGSMQLVQSLYAFGDGGFFGVGLGNGGQKMQYLFGSHTDFIYAVIGEELGLIGATCVLALFVAFAWRGFWISMHIRDPYKSLVAFGLTAFISVQALINMGVAVGVLPVTGIALPFISYGGTSLVVTLAMVGYILNLSRYMEHSRKKKL